MLYAVAIPLCYVALLLRSRTAQRSGDGWLVEKLEGEWADLKEVYFYWEAVVLFKKLLLAGFLTQVRCRCLSWLVWGGAFCSGLPLLPAAARGCHAMLRVAYHLLPAACCALPTACRPPPDTHSLFNTWFTRHSLRWRWRPQLVPGTLVQTNLALIAALGLFSVQSYAQPYVPSTTFSRRRRLPHCY